MPTRVKDREPALTDWEPISGMSFPKELYMSMLIEDVERELVEQVRVLTWQHATKGHFMEG